MLNYRNLFISSSFLILSSFGYSGNCPQVLSNDMTVGGGFSSVGDVSNEVGGGAGTGYSLTHWLFGEETGMIFGELPRLVKLIEQSACLYGKHFGQTNSPRLITEINCQITNPLTSMHEFDQFHFVCGQQINNVVYQFEAKTIDDQFIGILKRGQKNAGTSQPVWNAKAMFIGH